MTPPHADPGETWLVPAVKLMLADGSCLIKPGRPVLRATSNRTAQLTGVSKKNLSLLAEVGYIRRARPTPQTVFYYPGEVEEFIRQTEEDPDFWNDVRRKAYITTRRLRNPSERRDGKKRAAPQ